MRGEGDNTHQSANLAHARVGPLVAGHSLDTALLDAKLAGEALQAGIDAVAGRKLALVYRILVGRVADAHILVRILVLARPVYDFLGHWGDWWLSISRIYYGRQA